MEIIYIVSIKRKKVTFVPYLFQDIPSTGYSDWYDLCGRSAKSKVQGQIKVHLTLATREDHGIPIDDNFNDVQQHEDFLLIFIDHERHLFPVSLLLVPPFFSNLKFRLRSTTKTSDGLEPKILREPQLRHFGTEVYVPVNLGLEPKWYQNEPN